MCTAAETEMRRKMWAMGDLDSAANSREVVHMLLRQCCSDMDL